MSRWLKILLLLLAVAGVGLGSLPWWLELVLRPALQSKGMTFERYERTGYAHFQLHAVRYADAKIEFTAQQVEAVTPLVWLALRARGIAPAIAIEGWRVQRVSGSAPPSDKTQIAGLTDLRVTLQRLGPRVGYWLPRVHLTAGDVHGFGPAVTITQADWQNFILKVEGLRVVDQVLAFVLAPAIDGTIVLTAHTAENEARLRLVWSGTEIKGEAVLWEQPLKLAAIFPASGWLPTEASAVAENWRLPATLVKLGAPYALVRGDGRLMWRDGAFNLSLNARAESAANSKAPPLEASAVAQGNLRELTLTALHVDAPFATAVLTAPVTFSLDHPLSAESAQLIVQANLAKLPWIDARGTMQGTVTVAGSTAAACQNFELKFSDVAVQGFSVKNVQARGVLAWPRMELTELKVQLDETSSFEAHGSVDWQTRELAGVGLQAKLGSAWFARWLPAGASWSLAEVDATAEGPLAAPRHQGSLKLSAALWPPLQPFAVTGSWRGEGAKLEILSALAAAKDSTIELAGTLDPNGLQLTKFLFAPAGQAGWQLAAPAQLAWAPAWRADNLQLTGPTGQLTLKGRGEPDGFIDLAATGFDSSWLQDWVTLSGPGWRMHALHATGRVVGPVLVFETELSAQIEMSPGPAQVKLVASGDAGGVQLKEFKVVEAERVLTQATGRLPLTLVLSPTLHLSLDESAPLELSASTEPDSPLWAALSAGIGVQLTKPEAKLDLKGTVRQPAGELLVKVARISPGRLTPAPSPAPLPGDASRGPALPWESPQAAGNIPDLKISLPEFEDLAFALQVGRETITLTNFSAKLDGQAVQASGHVPMDDGRWEKLWHDPAGFDWSHAEARVEIPDADLAPLARRFPKFAAAQGRLHARVELTAGNKFSGELHLTDAAFRPWAPFSTLQEINADLALAGHTLAVRSLTAKLGGEPVSLTGSITLAPGGAPRLDLSLQGRNLPLVRNTGLLLRSDLDLHASTDDAGVTRLGGTVTVRDCLVLANLRLSTLLPTGRRGVTLQPPYFAVAAEPFRHWPLAVELRAERAVRVRTTMYNGTASAHFHVGGTLGEPRAVGELTVDQGQVLFPFASFKVLAGAVRLRESDPFHAVVNLNAVSQRQNYQLRLAVTGQLPVPNIALSSNPSLDADEVLLMVMTGRPPTGDTMASSSPQRFALLGAYLGRGLFQDLGFSGENRLEINTGMQVSDAGRETYEFEYKLKDRWSLVGEYDQFDSYNAGVKWRVYTEESKPDEKK
jgi:translocation and assembly module TamB